MKRIRKILCVVLALVFCLALPLSASAATATKAHETYGTLRGISSQIINAVRTTTTVSKNPDNATLRNGIQFSDGNEIGSITYYNSSAGATSFTHDFPNYMSLDCVFVYAFCSHEVYLSTSRAEWVQTTVSLTY